MTETTRKPRQTAANNAALARIKRAMNAKIYKVCVALMNSEDAGLRTWTIEAEGVEAVREYLRRFFNEDHKDSADRMIDGE